MAFSDPQKIIEAFGISEGATVADFGTGTGFYAVAAAKAVKDIGKVYAIDIQQDLLNRLKNSAHISKLNNIEVIHGDVEHSGGARIKENSVDVAIVANILFQAENKESLVEEAKRIVKPGGRVLVVDWSDSFGGMGPRPESVFSKEEARSLFEKKSFVFVSELFAGDHHYGLIFRK
jgi:ubiquinone/menaquinone biosynthesis C-methylase UbiE